MKHISMKNRSIFYIVALFVFLLAVQVFMFSNFFNELKSDTKVIEDFSWVRGSVQRYTKLELADVKTDDGVDLELSICKTIEHYVFDHSDVFEQNNVSKYYNLDAIQTSWYELKNLINDYHKSPSSELKLKVIEKSEECWALADAFVLRNQYLLDKTTAYYKYFIITFAINISAIILTLYLYKRFIYNQLTKSANHDSLTGLFNKGYFSEYLELEIARAVRKQLTFSLIMIDIDHFKMVNDIHGHHRGDYALETLADLLRIAKRNADVLARIGGEEFIMFLPDTGISGASILAERIRSSVQTFPFVEIGTMTISLGITEFNNTDTNESILKRVDSALYKAKERGRNRCEVIGGLE